MLSATFCIDQAENCELLADETADPVLAAEWRQMAQDWRAAALDADNDNADANAIEGDVAGLTG